MTFNDLIVLLPCQSLESLSLKRSAREAEELLSGWSALYHPALVAQAAGTPKWASAEVPPEDPAGSLIVVPDCVEGSLPGGWIERASAAGARLVRNHPNRAALLEAALAMLPEGPAAQAPCLAGDFLALGFCHFQVELLTRQLRYTSNLDEARFQQHLRDAAQSAAAGDENVTREHLRAAFDRLTEAREYFYPVETRLLDLTLVASTTLGAGLRAELSSGRPLNLMLSAAVLGQIARDDPDALAALKDGLAQGTVALVGGEQDEQELPLMAIEDVLAGLRRGLAGYQAAVGQRPEIFGRRRFGLTPLLPQVLHKLGFTGAVHFTLDDGRFPTSNQSKIRWEGLDGTEMEALARIPFDVRQADSYLRLAERLGNTMDLDQAATAVFVHWPGQSGPWQEDLRRMAEYGPVLGRFARLSDYFRDTLHAGRTERHEAEKYRSPYLEQEVSEGRPDPISRWVQHHRARAAADALQGVATLNALVAGSPGSGPESGLEAALARFGRLVAGGGGRSRESRAGYLVANPLSFARRLTLDVSDLDSLPEVRAPVLQAVESPAGKQVAVEVPPMGFAWVGVPAEDAAGDRGKRASGRHEAARLAADYQLRNEFCEVTLDPTTGAIQSIHNFALRGNRLAQQLAIRLVDPADARRRGLAPGSEEEYSVMAADEVAAVESGPWAGRVVARGRLLDRSGDLLARFVQATQVRRGSRIIELEIELDLQRELGPGPWKSYGAARFAWADETSEVHRGVGLTRRPVEGDFLEGPDYVDIRSPRSQFTILPGGLPYHRRFGPRRLDSLLVVRGERARRFRLGIGIDVGYCARAAREFLAADDCLVSRQPAPASPSGWLFHLDARNVLATHWEPVVAEGRAIGFRVRLLETEGRHARVQLRSFRPVGSARKTDFLGQTLVGLPVDADAITIELNRHEWAEIEALFAS